MKKRDFKLCAVSGTLFTVGFILTCIEGINIIPNVIGLLILFSGYYVLQQTTIYRRGEDI